MAGKMSPKFVALCSLAIGAIYSTGYSITNSSAAAAMPGSQQSQSGPTVASNPSGSSGQNVSGGALGQATNGGKGSVSSGSSSSSHSSSPNSATKPTSTTQKYLNGTYNGSAANPIGAISVAVTIAQGKIGNVQITACDTHYPENFIDPVLPDYVVSHQTTNIPVVSGATLSTEDFYYAVVQALTQAQNPHYKG